MYRHHFDPISFVFGLLFLALAALFVLPADPWDVFFGGVDLGWLWPLVVTGAGVALLAGVKQGGQTDRGGGEPDPDSEPI
jgi:hypothetical protein